MVHTRCFDIKQSIKKTNNPTTRGILLFPVIFRNGHFDAIEFVGIFHTSHIFALRSFLGVCSVYHLLFSLNEVSGVWTVFCGIFILFCEAWKVKMVPRKVQMNEKDKIVALTHLEDGWLKDKLQDKHVTNLRVFRRR